MQRERRERVGKVVGRKCEGKEGEKKGGRAMRNSESSRKTAVPISRPSGSVAR